MDMVTALAQHGPAVDAEERCFGTVAVLVVLDGDLVVSVPLQDGLTGWAEVGVFDPTPALVVVEPDEGVALLVPHGPTIRAEIGLLQEVVALVVLLDPLVVAAHPVEHGLT